MSQRLEGQKLCLRGGGGGGGGGGDDVVYSNALVNDFLLTQDTQLTLFFSSLNQFTYMISYLSPVAVHSAFSELWSVSKPFQMCRSSQHS
jgi:hypothetical protein